MYWVYELHTSTGRTDHIMANRFRRTLRRLDDWTLYAFNPRIPR